MILEDADRNETMLSRTNRNRAFLYRQLADILRNEIEDGKYCPGERLPSMDNLAAKYEVNKVTVRHALNELREDGLIYSVPAQGTYISDPTDLSQAMSSSKIVTVGLLSNVLAADQPGYYHMEMLEGIREEQSKSRINLVMLPVKYVQPKAKIINILEQSSLDVVILIGHFEDDLLRRILDVCNKSIIVDHTLRGAAVDTIIVNNREGGFQAMDHLLSIGRRENIGIITGPLNEMVSRERLDGAYDALDAHHIARESVTIIESDFRREGGYRSTAKILKDGKPSALFLMNDEMAAGALDAIKELSDLSVPGDISIVGFDDSALATACTPSLTTIHIAKPLMGKLAIQRAVSCITRSDHEPITTVVPTKLVVRDSSAQLTGLTK